MQSGVLAAVLKGSGLERACTSTFTSVIGANQGKGRRGGGVFGLRAFLPMYSG